jgi:hypothetical protein
MRVAGAMRRGRPAITAAAAARRSASGTEQRPRLRHDAGSPRQRRWRQTLLDAAAAPEFRTPRKRAATPPHAPYGEHVRAW